MFYSLVTGYQTLRFMKDIIRQNQLSAMAPRALPVLTVPAQPPLWRPQPRPWPRTPFQPSLGHPDLVGATPDECWSPDLPSWMDLRPMLQPCLQPCPCLRPFLLQTGSPRWTLTLGHRLLCLGMPMDHDTSLMCSDPVGQHPSVRALRRTPGSPPLCSSPTLAAP